MADKEVKLRVTTDTTQAVAGVNNLSGSLGNLQSKTGSVIGSIKSHWLGFTAAIATVAGAWSMASKTLDNMDSLSKMSQKLGVAVESLQTYQYAASLADVGNEQLEMGLAKLARTAYVAATGGKTQAESFAALGISVTDASGRLKSTDTLFGEIAGSFSEMEDGTKKTALAMQLFGKTGADLIPLLNEGKEGIAANRDELEKLGALFSADVGRQAEQFNDNITRVKTTLGGIATQLMSAMLPSMVNFSDALIDAAKDGEQLKTIGEGIAWAFKAVVSVVTGVVAVIDLAGTAISKLWQKFEKVGTILNPLTSWKDRITAVKDLWNNGLTDVGMGEALDKKAQYYGAFIENLWKKTSEASAKATSSKSSAGDVVIDTDAVKKSLSDQLSQYTKYYTDLKKLQEDYKQAIEKSLKEIADIDKKILEARRSTQEALYAVSQKGNLAANEMEEYSRKQAKLDQDMSYAITLSGEDRVKGLQDYQKAWADMVKEIDYTDIERKLGEHGYEDTQVQKTWLSLADSAKIAGDRIKQAGALIEQTQQEMKAAAEAQLASQVAGFNTLSDAVNLSDQWVKYLKTTIEDLDKGLSNPRTLSIDCSGALAQLQSVMALMSQIGTGVVGAGVVGADQIPAMTTTVTQGLPASLVPMAAALGSYATGTYQDNPAIGGGLNWDGSAQVTYIDSYAKGTDYVPRTGLYKLHQGEKVTPTEQNTTNKSMTINLGGITINGSVSNPEGMAKQLASALEKEIARREYLRGVR